MINVMFVCLGNICRSPMAEAVFRKMVIEKGLSDRISVDSSGTSNYEVGYPPHEGTIKILKKYKIPYDGIRARNIKSADLEAFDYIIAMDESNIKGIHRYSNGKSRAKIDLISKYASDDWISVPDPWYTGDFDLTYERVSKGCQKLLDYIIENDLNK